MAAPILIPCLVRLRTEFNALCPTRAKNAEGWIGDAAHRSRTSSHNPDETGAVPVHDADKVDEVHALDIDSDLRTAGLTMEMAVQHLLARCRAGSEKRLRFIIYARRIWEASNGWRQRTYTGTDPHVNHAHFDGSYDSTLEASAASWHLEDIPVALTADDKKWLSAEIAAQVAKAVAPIAKAVWATTWPHPVDQKPRTAQAMLQYAPSAGQIVGLRQQIDAARADILEQLGPDPAGE